MVLSNTIIVYYKCARTTDACICARTAGACGCARTAGACGCLCCMRYLLHGSSVDMCMLVQCVHPYTRRYDMKQ